MIYLLLIFFSGGIGVSAGALVDGTKHVFAFVMFGATSFVAVIILSAMILAHG